MTITDLTPIEILGESLAIPCDGPDQIPTEMSCRGANPAAWILHMADCCSEHPKQLLFCDICKDSMLSWLAVECAHCRRFWAPAPTAIVLIEPIGGTR